MRKQVSSTISAAASSFGIRNAMKGALFEHYALCRCGKSKNKPFCDGTHRYAKFTDEEN